MLNQQMGMPGVRAAAYTTTREILWGGDASRQKILRLQDTFSSAARDAGADPTTMLRPGLLLGRLTSGSKLVQWDPTATDGSQYLIGVNENELIMVEGFSAAATDRFAPYLVQAPLKASQLLILGTALTSSTHQYLARRRLAEMGCVLDDDPQGFLAGVTPRLITKTATGAITAAENGATFICAGSGAVTLTLPTLVPGLSYRFINTVAQNLIIASAGSSDDIIGLNDLSLDSITFSTASNQIGATVDLYSDYVSISGTQTLRWISTVQIGTATLA